MVRQLKDRLKHSAESIRVNKFDLESLVVHCPAWMSSDPRQCIEKIRSLKGKTETTLNFSFNRSTSSVNLVVVEYHEIRDAIENFVKWRDSPDLPVP